MKIFIHRFAFLLLTLAAAPAVAQEGPPPPHERAGAAMLREERRPFEMLVRARRELELSDAQVARLQEAAARLEARNRPLRERLATEVERYRMEERERLQGELRRLPPEARRRRLRELWARRHERALPPHLRPVAEEMRRNISEATREAQAVLTPEQKVRVRRMLEEHRRRVREERPRRPGGRHGPRGGHP